MVKTPTPRRTRRARAWRTLRLSLCVSAASGCTDSARPPFAGDGWQEDDGERPDAAVEANDDDEPLLVDQADETPSACGVVEAELQIQRPNFYFVLDSSGSMQDVMPDSGGRSRHEAAREAITEMLKSVGHRVNFGAATFPTPDSDDGCIPGGEVFPLVPGEKLSKQTGTSVVLSDLDFTLFKSSPFGATPTAPTLEVLEPKLKQIPGPTSVFLLTDGAPNCDTSEPCDVSTCIPNIEGEGFVGGPACDDEFNCCAPGLFPHLCLDDDDTVAVLQRLAESAVTTYVIGIPGSETYAQILNAMARAAGTARDGETEYFRVDDANELALTLLELGMDLSLSCELDLGQEPETRGLVNVFADNEAVPYNDEDGWIWLDETTVQLQGRTCNRWKRGNTESIRILEGCPVLVK